MKKIVSILLMVMLLACLPLSVSAATAGDEVTISFTAQNLGFAGYAATVNYDSSALELVSISANGANGISDVNGNSIMVMNLTPITDANLFTATFKVLPAAVAGTTYYVTATVTEAYDENVDPVALSISGGSIEIEKPVCNHVWGDGVVTTPAGCETPGVKTYTCQNDSKHTYTEEVPATGHAYDNGVVTTKPGCETPGVKTYTCQNDGKHTYTEEVPATGHTWDSGVVTTPGTCTNPGVKTYTCASCGATRTEAYGGAHDDRMGGDATHHWHYCAGCGEVWDKEEHSFDKNGKCVCGYNNPAGGNSDLDDVPDTGDITPVVSNVIITVISLMVAMIVFVFKQKTAK